jgi:hypothetical protein
MLPYPIPRQDRELFSGMTRTRLKIGNRWAKAETWGTDHLTYPSKTVEDEETVRKRTDVRGNGPTRKPVLLIWSTGLVSSSSG